MNKLQRWSIGIDLEKGFYQRQDDNGAWVDYKEAADLIESQQRERDELSATVERLRKIIGSSSLSDDPHVMSALNTAPQDNLNAIKREAWIKGFQFSNPIANGNSTEYMAIIRIANKQYPTTEGE